VRLRFAALFRESAVRIALALISFALLLPAAVAADASLDVYAKPGERVDIGNRRHVNLRCSGSGNPVVMLESGSVADSMAWHKVQPLVAAFTRVCSYDRAGYGFSDGGASSTDYIAASADDLHALIGAAKISTPVVLVGHSLGTDIARAFAERHRGEVSALVLVDPPPQDIKVSDAQRKQHDEENKEMMTAIAACGAEAQKAKGDTVPSTLQQCLRPPDPSWSPELVAAQRRVKLSPAFWTSVGAAMASGRALDHIPVPATEKHGAMPIVILQPDNPFGDAAPDERTMLEEARKRTQKAIAATSSQATIVPVAHSTHDVQFDQPQAVVEAIHAVIAKTKH
jgi:pimeloyl-ACP methyl ester carboxylesterase